MFSKKHKESSTTESPTENSSPKSGRSTNIARLKLNAVVESNRIEFLQKAVISDEQPYVFLDDDAGLIYLLGLNEELLAESPISDKESLGQFGNAIRLAEAEGDCAGSIMSATFQCNLDSKFILTDGSHPETPLISIIPTVETLYTLEGFEFSSPIFYKIVTLPSDLSDHNYEQYSLDGAINKDYVWQTTDKLPPFEAREITVPGVNDQEVKHQVPAGAISLTEFKAFIAEKQKALDDIKNFAGDFGEAFDEPEAPLPSVEVPDESADPLADDLESPIPNKEPESDTLVDPEPLVISDPLSDFDPTANPLASNDDLFDTPSDLPATNPEKSVVSPTKLEDFTNDIFGDLEDPLSEPVKPTTTVGDSDSNSATDSDSNSTIDDDFAGTPVSDATSVSEPESLPEEPLVEHFNDDPLKEDLINIEEAAKQREAEMEKVEHDTKSLLRYIKQPSVENTKEQPFAKVRHEILRRYNQRIDTLFMNVSTPKFELSGDQSSTINQMKQIYNDSLKSSVATKLESVKGELLYEIDKQLDTAVDVDTFIAQHDTIYNQLVDRYVSDDKLEALVADAQQEINDHYQKLRKDAIDEAIRKAEREFDEKQEPLRKQECEAAAQAIHADQLAKLNDDLVNIMSDHQPQALTKVDRQAVALLNQLPNTIAEVRLETRKRADSLSERLIDQIALDKLNRKADPESAPSTPTPPTNQDHELRDALRKSEEANQELRDHLNQLMALMTAQTTQQTKAEPEPESPTPPAEATESEPVEEPKAQPAKVTKESPHDVKPKRKGSFKLPKLPPIDRRVKKIIAIVIGIIVLAVIVTKGISYMTSSSQAKTEYKIAAIKRDTIDSDHVKVIYYHTSDDYKADKAINPDDYLVIKSNDTFNRVTLKKDDDGKLRAFKLKGDSEVGSPTPVDMIVFFPWLN